MRWRLAGSAALGIAPLVLSPLATHDDLHGRAPIDVAASDRLLRLPPERFPQPAAFDALQGEAVCTQGGDGVRPRRPDAGPARHPGHRPPRADLIYRDTGPGQH